MYMSNLYTQIEDSDSCQFCEVVVSAMKSVVEQNLSIVSDDKI